jgi:hypothetical protein
MPRKNVLECSYLEGIAYMEFWDYIEMAVAEAKRKPEGW